MLKPLRVISWLFTRTLHVLGLSTTCSTAEGGDKSFSGESKRKKNSLNYHVHPAQIVQVLVRSGESFVEHSDDDYRIFGQTAREAYVGIEQVTHAQLLGDSQPIWRKYGE